MDFLIKHWAPYPRRCPSPYRLISSNFVRKTGELVRWTFDTCNFSLILSGSGFFCRSGVRWEVHAPCVITQWPGEPLEYGPADGSWDEWYFVFGAHDFTAFQKSGHLDPERPLWPIADPTAINRLLLEFYALTHATDPASAADHADRIAERAIVATHISPPVSFPNSDTIQRAAAWVREHHQLAVDFEKVAKQFGFSSATFRRRWLTAFGEPPGKSLQRIRMTEACRLLVETDHPVKEIAARVGIPDEFYFSRWFRFATGHPPTRYRATYRLTH